MNDFDRNLIERMKEIQLTIDNLRSSLRSQHVGVCVCDEKYLCGFHADVSNRLVSAGEHIGRAVEYLQDSDV